ncbi:MAG: hypothetical protein AVDCRST_MAG65-1643, partial [uncultured Solirubrobacteraceae bacterium]
ERRRRHPAARRRGRDRRVGGDRPPDRRERRPRGRGRAERPRAVPHRAVRRGPRAHRGPPGRRA